MKTFCRLRLSALGYIYLTAMLAGCGGPQPPIGALHTHGSWITPQAKTIKKLLYISNDYPGQVLVYNYKTDELVGTISGFQNPSGQCVDAKGDVWIADTDSGIISEYAHGGTAVLGSVKAIQPIGCAISPSGDLAVSAASTGVSDELEVWKNASGDPIVYANHACTFLLTPAYDNRGNLIVEGDNTTTGPWEPCVLLAGSPSLVAATLNQSLLTGGGAAWDGQHIVLTAVRGRGSTKLLRVAIESPGSINVVGTTTLTNDPNCKSFRAAVGLPFVVGDKNTPLNRNLGKVLLGGNTCPQSRFGFWRYPSGGEPFKAFGSQPAEPSGSSVSIAD